MGVLDYVVGVGDALSKLVNRLIGGPTNESVSARAYRQRNGSRFWKVMYYLINGIFFWQENHCREEFEQELEYAKATVARGERHV